MIKILNGDLGINNLLTDGWIFQLVVHRVCNYDVK